MFCWTCLLLLAALPARADEEALPATVVAQARAVTAVVMDQDGRPRGTAFCIDPAGYFLANLRSLSGALGLSLLVEPGPAQRSLKCRSIREDAQLGLALLRAETRTQLPALEMGDSGKLFETNLLAVLGFPLNQAVPEKPATLELSIQLARVNSLRTHGETLESYRLSSRFAPAQAGAAVIDLEGHLVGVLHPGLERASQPATGADALLDRALPVTALVPLLSGPHVELLSANTNLALRQRLLRLVFAVDPLGSDAVRNPRVEVVTRVGNHVGRAFPLRQPNGQFVADFHLPDPQAAKPIIHAWARFNDGTVQGELVNAQHPLSEWDCRLGEVTSIERHDGHVQVKVVGGKLQAPQIPDVPLIVRMDSQTIELPLAKVERLRMYTTRHSPQAWFRIEVRDRDRVIVQLQQWMSPKAGLQQKLTAPDEVPLYSTAAIVHGVQLTQLRHIPFKDESIVRLAPLPGQQLLAVLAENGVRMFDTHSGDRLESYGGHRLTDLQMSPSGRTLFLTEPEAPWEREGEALTCDLVHRYDAEARIWEVARAPKSAQRIEAVSDDQFILQESLEYSSQLSLNTWTPGDTMIRELARTNVPGKGDMKYLPSAGRVVYMGRVISKSSMTSFLVSPRGFTQLQQFSNEQANRPACISPGGLFVCFGRTRYPVDDLQQSRTHSRVILASTADLVLTYTGCFDATTGAQLHSWPDRIYRAAVSACGDQVCTVSREGFMLYAVGPKSAP